MNYDPGALRSALAAAVGDDPALVAELRDIFLSGAEAHAHELARAADVAAWRAAALRLQGLAASFGAVALMAAAEEAAAGPLGDPAALRKIGRAIVAFDG
jgi:histidine phosphotransfer protein HptB